MFSGIHDGALDMERYLMIVSEAFKRYVNRSPPQCVVPTARQSIGSHSFKSHQRFVANHVLQYMRKHPGVAVITSGIGSRNPMKWEVAVSRQMHGQPELTSRTHYCVKTALVIAIFAIRGKPRLRTCNVPKMRIVKLAQG